MYLFDTGGGGSKVRSALPRDRRPSLFLTLTEKKRLFHQASDLRLAFQTAGWPFKITKQLLRGSIEFRLEVYRCAAHGFKFEFVATDSLARARVAL